MTEACRWDDSLQGRTVLDPHEVEDCLDSVIRQAQHGGTPLTVLCAYRPAFKLGPREPSDVVAVASIMVHNIVRPTDYTGMIDGSVIVIVLPNTDVAGAWVVAERITTALQAREGTKRWEVTPITHAEQFGSAQRILQSMRRLTSDEAA